jgi:hypothetical protein
MPVIRGGLGKLAAGPVDHRADLAAADLIGEPAAFDQVDLLHVPV